MNLPSEFFSWSQYQKYTNCGIQYYFRYVKKIYSPPNEYAIRGTAFHGAVKTAVLTRDLDQTVETYDTLWEQKVAEAVADGANFDTDTLDTLEREGRNITIAFFEQRAGKIEVKGPESFEIEMKWKLGDVPMHGFIDCVDKHQDFIDFKTSKRRPTQPPWGQGILYADGAEKLWNVMPRNIRFEYGVPYANKEEPAKVFYFKKSWKSTKREPHLNAIQYAAKEISNNVFAPCQADSWVCSPAFCDYYQMCEFGKDRAIDARILEGKVNVKKPAKKTASAKKPK